MANGNDAVARMVANALIRHDMVGDFLDDVGDDDDDVGYDDDEVGRRRGRSRRRARRAGRKGPSEDEQLAAALKPSLEQRIAAARAAEAQKVKNLGFDPNADYRGVLGIPNVLVPAAGGFQQARAVAEEPTQLSRLSFTCWDPAGVIGPQDAICYMGVTNIRIGTQSIFSTTTPASLDSLGSRATYAMVMTRVLSTGQSLTVDYVNDHPTAQLRVRGTGFGPTPNS